MTTKMHTDITFGAPATAAVVNAPLDQLDSALADLEAVVSDFVVSGGLAGTSVNLTVTQPAVRAFVQNSYVTQLATTLLMTASKDNYVDLDSSGVYHVTAVNNNAAAPGVFANSIRLYVAVASPGAVTAVTDLRPGPNAAVQSGRASAIAPFLGGAAPGAWEGSILDWGGLAFNVKSVNNPGGAAKCDHQAVTDAIMGAASAILTSASGKFKATDVGKLAIVQAAGAGATTLSTTIASFQSVNQVTLAAPSGPAVNLVQFDWASDDTAPANGSITAAAAMIGGGSTGLFGSAAAPAGVAAWPAPGMMVTAPIVPKSGVTVDAYGATLYWGAPSGAQTSIVANPPPAIGANLNGFRIRGLTADALLVAAVSGITLSSWQNGSLSDISLQRISGAAPCAALRIEASTGNSAYNNSALNTVANVRCDQVNVMVQMSGKDGNTVVTDITFMSITGSNVFVGGFRHTQWNDSCTVVGSLVSLSSTGYGCKFNDSATPLADVGVYNHTYYGPSFDAFNGPGLGNGATYPIVFNWSKNISFYGMFTGPTGTPGWTDLFLNTAAQSFRIEYDGQGLRGITGSQIGTFTLNEYRTLGNTSVDSPPTNRGFLRLLGGQGGLSQDGGIEFQSSGFGAGYGWRIGAPDAGGGDEPLIFMYRAGSASWTELLRLDSLATAVRFATAVSRIIPGATSFSHRNNANSADNLLISDAGLVSARAQLYPGAEAIGIQTTGGILHATGVPANGNGNNNDWCISDNGHLYFRAGGVWAEISWAGALTVGGALISQKDRRISKQSPAFNAAPAPDPTAGEIYAMAALTGAVNVANPINAAQGQRLFFIWTQDGTGGRAVAYTGTNWRSVGIAAQATTLSTVTIDEAVCVDGTIWRVNRLVTGQTI